MQKDLLCGLVILGPRRQVLSQMGVHVRFKRSERLKSEREYGTIRLLKKRNVLFRKGGRMRQLDEDKLKKVMEFNLQYQQRKGAPPSYRADLQNV